MAKPVIKDTVAGGKLLVPITPEEAQLLEDRIYELTDEFFRKRADKIETENTIVDADGCLADYEHSNEVVWYDDAREECREIAYRYLAGMFKKAE